MKGICLKFQNVTSWTITDQPPNIKPDILHVAVCKAPILASLGHSYIGTKERAFVISKIIL